MGRVVVVALAASTMLLAPLALLQSGAATQAATGTVTTRPAASAAPASSSIGATQLVTKNVPVRPATPAERARHLAAVRHNQAIWHASRVHRASLLHEAAVLRASSQQSVLARHAAAVAHNQALWRAAQTRHAAALRAAAAHRTTLAHSRVGIATWYAWHPGQCASPFLPHGTLLTVTDLATNKTIHCLVTDTEAHNPGRVVDLSQDCFEQLGALSQGVIEVRHQLVTLTRSRVTALLREHDIAPSRALGQNFLVDPNTARRIVRLAGVEPGDAVVEIGPGLGSLTVALLDAGAAVVAVEVDRRLAAVVAEVTEGRCKVVVADALTVDLDGLCGGRPVRVVANLPYNVAVPIVVRVLEEAPCASSLFVMVQAEVADRLAAAARTPAYGAVSVKVAYYATAKVAGRVPRTVFLPEPNVDSSLVAIERRARVAVDPDVVTEARLFEVVRTAFAHRRKMLRRSLEGTVDPAAYARSGVAPTQRPEELDVEAFGRLAALS